MKPRNLEPVRVYCVVIALVGAGLLVPLFLGYSIEFEHPSQIVAFGALSISVLIGELFPIEAPRRSGDGEITVSVMFSFALLLGLGLVPALVAQLTASIVQDCSARKPWWQIGFNIGQYTLSLSAAAGVMSWLGAYGALRNPGFGAIDLFAVQRLLEEHGVDGHALTLELTESSLMVDPEMAKRTMRQLAELGVSVAIDDFGTGYSSLAYLTDLPIGELKIDKSFVRAMSSDSRNAIVVRSTIELAHNLGLRTVAEGIEDALTFERLRALGCELAQGFHMSKPLPASGLLNWCDIHAGQEVHAPVAQTGSPIVVPRLSVA